MMHKKKHYDILIVGGGLTGAMIAYKNRGKSVLVLEKKENIGGFCFTEEKDNIMIHKYGPHIFHTNKKEVWDFVNSITPFNPF
jgi:UDP-galactopyranose mutase